MLSGPHRSCPMTSGRVGASCALQLRAKLARSLRRSVAPPFPTKSIDFAGTLITEVIGQGARGADNPLPSKCRNRRKLFQNLGNAAPKFGIAFLQGGYFFRVHAVGVGVYGNLIDIV